MLANKCYACHTTSKLGDLRLDSREAMLQGGKSGPAIVPGKPDESLLIRAVKHVDPKLKMPMAGDKLSEREIADLARWIQTARLGRNPLPRPSRRRQRTASRLVRSKGRSGPFSRFENLRSRRSRTANWAKNPIDSFILARLEEKGLKPVKPADKRVLLRRASL